MHRFPAQVDHAVATAVLDEAAAAQTGAERVHDLSACERFDSSLIAVLLELVRRAQVAGARCSFEAPSENVLRLAGLYGVAPLLFGTRNEPGVVDPRNTAASVHTRSPA